MGVYQTYRGNAENKMFYLIDQLVGGINTEFNDDTSPDNEFYNIVNFDMDTRGSLYKRMGFGKLDAVSQIMQQYPDLPDVKGRTPEDPNPETSNDNIVYMKMLQNDNGVFRNLSAYTGEKAYRDYQKVYGKQNNSFELLLITSNMAETTSKAWRFKCTLPELEYVDGVETATETIILENETYILPVYFTWDKTLRNIETIEFFDKIYFTTNDKGLVVFNRVEKTFSYAGFAAVDVVNTAYKPNSMEVRKVGFNLLGTDPLYWVDYQGLVTESIQGVYITTMESIPSLVLPYGGKFRLNVLYTGADNGFTLELKEGDKAVTHTAAVNAGLSKTGLKVYDIIINEVPTAEVEIKLTKTGTALDPYYDYYQVGAVDTEAKPISPLSIGEYGICEMYNRAVYYKGDTIWFSEINKFNYVPNYNYVSLPIEPTDRITKVIFFRNVYIVFTKYNVYKMIGQFGTTEFQVMPVNTSVGCHAPNTVIPIENELYFASPRGLYSLKSSDFRDGIENLRELDTKVKTLTSNVTLYLGEIDKPAVRYNGISEQAYAIRYKDKYMLFFNTSYEDNQLTEIANHDALVYKYEMKAYTLLKFPIKPTFMFLVDNAITTFCTIQAKEDYTEEEVLLQYDFETASGSVVQDLSVNNLDGTVINGVLQPRIGASFNGTTEYAKLGNLESTVPLDGGFEISFKAKLLSLVDNATVFDLGQLVATSSAAPSSGSVFTSWSQGYRAELQYSTTPNPLTNQSNVNYTLLLHRENTSVNANQSGTFTLTEGTNTLIASTAFTFAFESALSTTLKTGSFTVTHDSTGNYSKTWNLTVNTQYPTYVSGVYKGPDVSANQRYNGNWDAKYGLRYVVSAKAYDWGSRVSLTPYVSLGLSASLNVGARSMNAWCAGQGKVSSVPAINSSGNQDIAGSGLSWDITYSGGSYATTLDLQYMIQATISGVYRNTVEVDSLPITLPEVIPYTETVWNAFSLTASQLITFSSISNPSKREIYMLANADGSVKIGANSEYETSSITISGVMDTAEHTWKIVFNKSTVYNVAIYKDEISVGTGTIPLNAVLNTLRDNCMVGKSNSTNGLLQAEMTLFQVKLAAGAVLMEYTFNKGSDNTLLDNSSAGRDGTFYGTWLVETGLQLNGANAYVSIPEISDNYRFSNGYTIEFEAKLENTGNIVKIIDLATGYDTGSSSNLKGSINIESALSTKTLSAMTSSMDLKTYKVQKSNMPLTERHLWKVAVVDTGTQYTMSIYMDGVLQVSAPFNYGGISNVVRKSNFIGRSNRPSDGYLKGMLYNLTVKINASASTVPIYESAVFEYDTTSDDFGRAMEVILETKGINLRHPLHIKKLKNIFIKGSGGFSYQDFLFSLEADGHLANNPYAYTVFIDEVTKEVVYDYSENKDMFFSESTSLLGNMRLDKTSLGQSPYETRKLVLPAKGKNFTLKMVGESKDMLGIESFGFVFKLGKVKER